MTFGLNDEEVIKSKNKYGSNELISMGNNSFFHLLIESLSDPIIKILLIALAIKIVFLFRNFDWYETLGIMIAIFLASFISSISEYGSNKAFEKLQKESSMIKTKVYRNNSLTEIFVNNIVVGDVVKLTSGDKVPADGHVIKGYLYNDESFLTGETIEIEKRVNDIVYGGSTVYKGDALILIDSVGKNTKIGKISLMVDTKNEESPLKKKLHILAKEISFMGYIGAFLSSFIYLFMQIIYKNHFDISLIMETIKNFPLMMEYLIYSLTLSVTIIIMAVPEGLPMMITLVLSSNMKKMLKDNVLVRRLVGIETSGSLNVLLCDKTGTLTNGKLKLIKIISGDGMIFNSKKDYQKYPFFDKIQTKSLYLNNESVISDGNIIGGNITDKAIMEFVGNENINDYVLYREEFSSKTKYSYVKCSDYFYYKGAPEVILPKCHYYLDKDGNKVLLKNSNFINNIVKQNTMKGYRVIANAYGENKNDLIFISILIIKDTVRKEAYESIKGLKNAGIKVVMITGDNKDTALSIGKELGIYKIGDNVLSHDEINNLSDKSLMLLLDKLSIVARALPEDKARLVSLYKKNMKIVGMTGDGVNDAVALKKSDVSFALGSGQEVAKEASDIVILDDNIYSIYKSVLYGRTIFKSIRKFVTYQLTVNVCALILSTLGAIVGVSTPITIIQMLWLNMIMDTFAGLAFSYEPALKEYMEEKPKKINEEIMNKYMINEVVVNGIYSAIICILFLKIPLIKMTIRPNENFLLTAFFALFIFLGIINAFLSRTHRLNIFAGILKNKVFIFINLFIIIVQLYIIYFGGNLFRTYGLTIKELFLVIMLSFTIFPVDYIRKKYLKCKKIPLGV